MIDVCFVHDTGQTASSWVNVMEELPNHVSSRAIFLNYNSDNSLEQQAAQALGLIGDSPVTLCGIGHGAAVAATIAARHPERVDKLMLSGVHTTPADTLPQITAPTLITCGQLDITDRAASRHAASLIPNARLEIVPLARHHWHEKHPKRFAKYVTQSLQPTTGAAAAPQGR